MLANNLSPSSEDYLETILELSDQKEAVRSVDIADHLNVSKASVSKAMGILRQAGLIDQAFYGLIHLTDDGRERANEILLRHTMLKRFLMEILNLDETTAEMDACRMEHVISPVTMEKWMEYLSQILQGNLQSDQD